MQKEKGKKSVSLVEIVIATVILTLVVSGLISAFLTVRHYIRRANERTVATSLSYSDSRVLPFVHIDASTWVGGDLDPTSSPVALPPRNIDGITYDGRQYRVTQGPIDPVWGYREVDIDVQYEN